MNKLIIEDDEGKTTIVPLIRDEITIGRKEGNTIRLTERNVSRRHAKLIKNNGAILLEDLGSYNGIKVNGDRIKKPVEVNEGDRIQIGDYMLALKVDAQRASKADPFEEMKTIPMEKEEVEANIAEHERAAQEQQDLTKTIQDKVPAGAASGAQASDDASAPAAAAEAAPSPAAAEEQAEQKADLVDEKPKTQLPGPAGRVVILSSPFRGKEFELSTETTIIGRWPENDVVIDHQSISRHHAKILREDNRYTIVDMGSQNGVLVNGDKYDRVELRKGDMVDLGHVRMRYIAPNEDFDVNRDIDWDEGKSRMGLYVTIGILAAVGLLAAIFFFWLSGEKKKKDDKDGKKVAGKNEGAETNEAAGMDGMVPRVSSLDRSKINAAIDAKDWEKAIAEAKAFLKLHTDDAKAKELMQQAKNERENEKTFKRFMKSWKRGRYLAAAKLGKGFPQDSIYFKEIKNLHPQAVEKYTAPLLKKAKGLARRKKCSELRALSKKVTDINPAETRFQTLVDSCGKDTALANGSSSRGSSRQGDSRTTTRTRTRDRTRPRERESSSGKSAEQLAKEARDSWARNNCSRALRLARKAYRKKHSTLLVYIIGSCACKTGRPKTAKWAYRKLSGGRKRMVARACKAKNITLP